MAKAFSTICIVKKFIIFLLYKWFFESFSSFCTKKIKTYSEVWYTIQGESSIGN